MNDFKEKNKNPIIKILAFDIRILWIENHREYFSVSKWICVDRNVMTELFSKFHFIEIDKRQYNIGIKWNIALVIHKK